MKLRTDGKSWAQYLAEQPFDFQDQWLASKTPEERKRLKWSWQFWGRPNQIMPKDDFFVWLILAGRGWGKTRTAVENMAAMQRGSSPLIAKPNAPKIMSIIADSPADMRQYTIEGPSGFANVGPRDHRPTHYPSIKTLVWPNGAKAMLFSAEDPEALRGASGEFFWWDELAKSKYAAEGWMNLMFGMREGNPKGIVTTTPRPKKLLIDLISNPSTFITRGSTLDNEVNLAKKFMDEVVAPQLQTRTGRQEIFAEILTDVPGALWSSEQFDEIRLKPSDPIPDMKRIVVAVDPSGTKGEGSNSNSTKRKRSTEEKSNDVGIVVAGIDFDNRIYILADRTCNLSPAGWGRKAVDAYHEFDADLIVAERNYGGAMVQHVIRTTDVNVPFKEVTASRGKVARAEPIASLYEQRKVRHVFGLQKLEDQMCLMTPDGFQGSGSPDRVDAMVWAVTELALKRQFVNDMGIGAPEIIY